MEIKIIPTKKLKQEISNLDIKITSKNLEDFIKHKTKPFYTAIGANSVSQKVFLKISLLDNERFDKNLSREIETRKFLKKIKTNISFPLLIDSNNKKPPYWFLSEYLEGKILGSFFQIYFKSTKYIDLITKTLASMRNIDKKQIDLLEKNKKFYHYKRDFNSYLDMINGCQDTIEKEKIINFKIDFDRIKRFFKKQEKYFKEADYVLSHGDFTLANIVVPPGKNEIIITDWEHAHIDNYVYDLSRLWIQLWRYPEWRKTLLQSFMNSLPKTKKQNFKNLFRSVIITEALTEILGSLQVCKKEYKKPGIKSALKTINNSLMGFNNLLK